MKNNNYILVTGCYGFVAQHLIYKLLKQGHKVVGIFNKKYQLEIFDTKNYQLKKKFIIVKGDITKKNFIRKLLKTYNFKVCFHLAAVSQVLDSNINPLKTFNTNIFGTINILENFRIESKKTSIIFSSSDKVYGDSKNLPYNEKTPLNAINPYDVSKASADLICRSYAHTFGLNIAITRFVNIYGPGDVNWDRIIPGTINSLLRNKKPVLRSNGKFLRDYIYIDDVVDGYLKLSKNLNKNPDKLRGKSLNFGSNNPISAIEIVKTLLKIFKVDKKFIKINNIAKNEIKDQYSNYIMANKLINWRPQTKLNKGLKKSIIWYKKILREKI
jgi:CDP-glucose 4,6-dehydratase